MDEQDEKMIKELKRNARASISVLSKKLGLPRTTIHYRMRKLIK
jgi:DNA-binding Lrp family transcriptional regulator